MAICQVFLTETGGNYFALEDGVTPFLLEASTVPCDIEPPSATSELSTTTPFGYPSGDNIFVPKFGDRVLPPGEVPPVPRESVPEHVRIDPKKIAEVIKSTRKPPQKLGGLEFLMLMDFDEEDE